ncbi:MAG: hypothetical protein Ct9H300mP5_5060 [Candidatus Pelagibacterales bacterium]|nr:MAG: hypothetical protein Ct9H300mP5_5060 [Pelagibacterales bacterium]
MAQSFWDILGLNLEKKVELEKRAHDKIQELWQKKRTSFSRGQAAAAATHLAPSFYNFIDSKRTTKRIWKNHKISKD